MIPRVKVWALLCLTAVLLAACSQTVGQPSVALRVTDTVTGIGAVTDDTSEQALTYAVTLQNFSDQPILVSGVEPVLSPEFNDLVLVETLWLMVDETVAPGKSVTVGSTLLFATDDLTKEQLGALALYITHLRVTTVTTLPLPAAKLRR